MAMSRITCWLYPSALEDHAAWRETQRPMSRPRTTASTDRGARYLAISAGLSGLRRRSPSFSLLAR